MKKKKKSPLLDPSQNNWLHNSFTFGRYLVEAPFGSGHRLQCIRVLRLHICKFSTFSLPKAFKLCEVAWCIWVCLMSSHKFWLWLDLATLLLCGFGFLFLSEVVLHTRSYNFSYFCSIRLIFSPWSRQVPAAKKCPQSLPRWGRRQYDSQHNSIFTFPREKVFYDIIASYMEINLSDYTVYNNISIAHHNMVTFVLCLCSSEQDNSTL